MRYLVYMWFDDGQEGYVTAYDNYVESIVSEGGKRLASRWQSREAADNWVSTLVGYSKEHYVRHETRAYGFG